MVETVRLGWFRPEKWGLDPCLLPDYSHFLKICTKIVLGTLRYAPSPRAGHMSPYKGRRSPKTFVVETEVPLGGFRKRLDPMYEFHTRRRIEVHHIPRRRDDERD